MLQFLFDIDWNSLSHAYGRANDVPDQLLRLNSPIELVRKNAQWELYGNIYHQGTVYEASAFAIPFLVELLYTGENVDTNWVEEYIDDISMWNWEEVAEENGFDPKTTEVPYNLHNIRKVSYEMCDKIKGYSVESFVKVRKELDAVCLDSFKSYSLPNLENYEMAYMGRSKDDMEKKVESLKKIGHWDIQIRDDIYQDQYVVFVPRGEPQPKPMLMPKPPKVDISIDAKGEEYICIAKEMGEHYSDALEILELGLERNPCDNMILHEIFETYLKMDEPSSVIKYIQIAKDKYPLILGATIDIARAYLSMNQNGMAVDYLKKALGHSQEDTIYIHELLAIPAFLISDFRQAYESIGIALDNLSSNLDYYCLFEFFSIYYKEYDKEETNFNRITKVILNALQIPFYDFVKRYQAIHTDIWSRFQNCGIYNIKPDDVLKEYLNVLIKKFEANKEPKNESHLLEHIFFIYSLKYEKERINLPNFDSTESTLNLFESWMDHHEDYWYTVNQMAWDYLLKAQEFGKKPEPYHYDHMKIAQFLIQQGHKRNNIKMKCFGKDLVASLLADSMNFEDLRRAKDIFEELKQIDENFYTPENYQKVLVKLNQLEFKN